MSESVKPMALPSSYDGFLFARVGTDVDGVSVSVLSILARLGLDPWDEAAKLSKLPRAVAVTVLTAFIGGRSNALDDEKIAEALRLVSLLKPVAKVSTCFRPEPFRSSSESGGVGFAICLFVFVFALGAIGLYRLGANAAASGRKEAPAASIAEPSDVSRSESSSIGQ